MSVPEASPEEERVVWEGHPSHALYAGTYLLCLLFFWLIIPIFIAFWRWLEIRSRHYELTNQRLFYTTGIFSRKRDEKELYRIKDFRVELPFKLRIFGVGNVHLESSDRTSPQFTIEAVRAPRDIANTLRALVEKRRTKKGVREVDMGMEGFGG